MLLQVGQVFQKRAERTMEALSNNNMKPYYVETRDQVVPLLKELIEEGSTVAFGGSQTLDQCAVLPFIRNGSFTVLDRYAPGLTPQELKELYRKSFSADVYLSSINAITEDGWLYAVDGSGNRVAALIYGPEKVIIIAGINKIVENLDEAATRVERIAGPANAMRLNLKTPCVEQGVCQDCNDDSRICCSYIALGHQKPKGRISVILVGEGLGY